MSCDEASRGNVWDCVGRMIASRPRPINCPSSTHSGRWTWRHLNGAFQSISADRGDITRHRDASATPCASRSQLDTDNDGFAHPFKTLSLAWDAESEILQLDALQWQFCPSPARTLCAVCHDNLVKHQVLFEPALRSSISHAHTRIRHAYTWLLRRPA